VAIIVTAAATLAVAKDSRGHRLRRDQEETGMAVRDRGPLGVAKADRWILGHALAPRIGTIGTDRHRIRATFIEEEIVANVTLKALISCKRPELVVLAPHEGR
jgi:hypothetical protein